MNIMSLKKRSRLGFTLVELIVVIAILAILAGVAIPVYSGYIKKASKAADLTLLDAANSAFAAACLENMINSRALTKAVLKVENKRITGVASVNGLEGAAIAAESHEGYALLGAHSADLATTVDDISASFARYFGTNASVELRYFTSERDFTFVPSLGIFAPADGTPIAVSLSNGSQMTVARDNMAGTTAFTVDNGNGQQITYTANNDDLDNVTHSTFGENMEMGDLMGQVSGVVGAAVSAIAGDGNTGTLKTVLGDYIQELNLDPDTATAGELGNALVLMVAENTGEGTAEALMSMVSSGQGMSLNSIMVRDEENNIDMGATLANAAAIYGMLTGFANSDIGHTATVNQQAVDENGDPKVDENGDPVYMTVKEYYDAASAALSTAGSGSAGIGMVANMMNVIMQSNGTNEYLSSGQAETDLAGYISAMSVIAGNTDALTNGSGVLSAGFTDENLVAILNGIFG